MWTQTLKTLAIKNNNRGFSIVELVVTMSIIAVLTTVSSIGYKSYQSKARLVTARSTLGSIMQVAKAFKADKGYFLPNLKAMGVRFKGELEYNYDLICGQGTGNLCGSFDYPDPGAEVGGNPDPCGSSTNSCLAEVSGWYGHVMEHSIQCYPGALTGSTPVGSFDFPRYSIDTDFARDFFESPGFYYSRPSFPDLCQQAQDAGEDEIDTAAKAKIDSLFLHRGSAHNEVCGGNESSVRGGTAECFSSNEYVMRSDALDIYGFEHSQSQESEPFHAENLLSGPYRLVLIALGCQNKEDSCDNTKEYQIMTLSSQTNIYTERLNRNYTPPPPDP